MRVLLYKSMQKLFKKSGIGRAYEQQTKALQLNQVNVVTDKDEPFDVVHFNTIFKDSYVFLKKCKKNNIPVIVHGHSTKEDFLNSFNFSNVMKSYFYKNLERMYSNADLIITPTEYAKGLITSYGYVNCPIVVLSNGIDINAYQPNPISKKAFRDYFDLKEEDKVVIGIGLLFERKGLHDFIEVAKSFPQIKFIWFGNLAKSLQTKKIKDAISDKSDNVILPGYIKGDVIKGALTSANLMFFPSYEETEGIVLLEAMASKLPLLIRDIPIYESFEHGKTLFKASSNEGFIKQIQAMLSMDLDEVTNRAYEDVKQKDLPIIGKELKRIYEELLEKRQ